MHMDRATPVLDKFGSSLENNYTALSELSGVPTSTLWHRDHGPVSIRQRAAEQQYHSPQVSAFRKTTHPYKTTHLSRGIEVLASPQRGSLKSCVNSTVSPEVIHDLSA